MKKLLLYSGILFAFISNGLNAQWTPTNVTFKNNGDIGDMCIHNGALYATVFDSGLVKLDENTQQWERIQSSLPSSSNASHYNILVSTGNYLYAFARDQYTVSTIIYKSSDNGATFVTDTVGHPRYGPYPTSTAGYPYAVQNAYSLNGKIFIILSNAVYSKYPDDAAWVKVTEPDVEDAEIFIEHDNTWYAMTYLLQKSTDNGQTWPIPANAGFPQNFNTKIMNINSTTGRIYVAGYSDKYSLLYSDDFGESWDSLAINQYLGLNWIGNTYQRIIGLISKDNNVTIVLTNDANSSHPDVMSSSDGGQSFSVDTVGLQGNASGTILVNRMLYFKDKLYIAFNYNDIYTQDEGAINTVENSKKNIKAYPNPVLKILNIESESPILSIQITNSLGEIIKTKKISGNTHQLDFNDVPKGVCFVRINSINSSEVIKILKE